MSLAEVHEFNIGTRFIFTVFDQDKVVIDISTATTMEVLFQRPDRTTFAKVAIFTGDGTDGRLEYVSEVNDLTPAGDWFIQARVANLPSSDFRSEVLPLKIHGNIDV